MGRQTIIAQEWEERPQESEGEGYGKEEGNEGVKEGDGGVFYNGRRGSEERGRVEHELCSLNGGL